MAPVLLFQWGEAGTRNFQDGAAAGAAVLRVMTRDRAPLAAEGEGEKPMVAKVASESEVFQFC